MTGSIRGAPLENGAPPITVRPAPKVINCISTNGKLGVKLIRQNNFLVDICMKPAVFSMNNVILMIKLYKSKNITHEKYQSGGHS